MRRDELIVKMALATARGIICGAIESGGTLEEVEALLENPITEETVLDEIVKHEV